MNAKVKIFLIKLVIIIILFFSIVISTKENTLFKVFLKEKVFTNNISFKKFQNIYSKYFGNIIPFNKYMPVTPVFSEKIEYISKEKYKDGVKLKVSNNYLMPSINSGIVVFIGEKEDYGNTIIIEGDESIWYSNINSNLKLYDQIKKGEYLGEVNGDEIYLVFKKEGKLVDYKEYL